MIGTYGVFPYKNIRYSNALAHFESSHIKRLGVAMQWNIWSLLILKH